MSNFLYSFRKCFQAAALLSALLGYCLPGGVLHAAQSLRLNPGVTGSFNVPANATFNNLGSSRLEMRIHNFTIPVENTIVFKNAVLQIELRPGNELCVRNLLDGMYDYGSFACADVAGQQDLVLRIQRNLALGQLQFEVMGTSGSWRAQTYCGTIQTTGNGNRFPCPLRPIMVGSWAGAGQIGGIATQVRIAWIKWSSTLLPLNSPVPTSYASADLANWNFEGNGQESVRGINISVANNYVSTPIYLPVAAVRTLGAPDWSNWLSFRAGYPGQLDGSGSYTLTDSPPIAYNWEQIDGPSTLIFDNNQSMQPEVRGMIFGTYKVRLIVVDELQQAAATEFSFGAVATDNNGVVIQADPSIEKILGPMIAFGRNDWEWADSRHKYLADFFGGQLSTNFRAIWKEFKPGTVSVTNGSPTLTGTGTNFAADLDCSSADSYLVIEYPDAGVPGGFAYKGFKVNPGTCTATTLTLNGNWAALPGTTSGLRYSNFGLGGWLTWVGGGTNANYYDNVMAHYALYYRSGNTLYRDYARTLADRWFQHPFFDYGRGAGSGAITINGAPRLLSLTGLTLRALDGQPLFWNWLRGQWNYHQTFMSASGPFEDTRESAYQLQSVVLGSLFDPDSNRRTSYAASLQQGLQRWITQQKGAGNWTNEYAGAGSYTVTTGSTTVTGAGFEPSNCVNTWLRFGTENYGYRCSYVSPTQLTLNAPYRGTSGVKPLQLGNLVGQGTQPFMLGLAANVVGFAALAGGNGAMPAAINAMNWLTNYGLYPPAKGLFYGRGFAGCEPSTGGPADAPVSVRECKDSGDGEGAMRVFAGEALGAFSRIYPTSQIPAHKALGDDLYTANFGKPGFRLPDGITNPEGFYNLEAEDNGYTVAQLRAKDYGFFWGFGLASSWPAARLGGARPAAFVDASIGSALSDTPGAATARITVTQPSGATAITLCQEDNCTVQVDTRQGTHLAMIEYLDSGNALLPDLTKKILIDLP